MKTIFTTILSLCILSVTFGQTEKEFINAVRANRDSVVKNEKKLVTNASFSKIASKNISRQLQDYNGTTAQSSILGVEVNEDKTKANIAISFNPCVNWYLTGGLNFAIDNNSFEIYSGSNDLGTDFDANLSITYIFKNTNKLIFYENARPAYIYKRDIFITNLVKKESPFMNNLDAIEAKVKLTVNSSKDFKISDDGNITGGYGELTKEDSAYVLKYLEIFGTKELTAKEKKEKIDEYVEEKFVEFETKEAAFSGFSYLQVTVKPIYINKNYYTYNDTLSSFTTRFGTRNFSSFGGSLTGSWIRSVKKAYSMVSLELGVRNANSLESPEAAEFAKTFTKLTYYHADSSGTGYASSNKDSYMTSAYTYKEKISTFIGISGTGLWTKKKSVGLTAYAKLNFSELYSENDNMRLDVGAGPAFAVVDSSGSSSKANFALIFGMNDITNKKGDTKIKQFIKIQVNIPLTIIGTKD